MAKIKDKGSEVVIYEPTLKEKGYKVVNNS